MSTPDLFDSQPDVRVTDRAAELRQLLRSMILLQDGACSVVMN